MLAVTTIVVYCTCFVIFSVQLPAPSRLAIARACIGIIAATASRTTCIPTGKEPRESEASSAVAIGAKKAHYTTSSDIFVVSILSII